jgi:hypothetical protein
MDGGALVNEGGSHDTSGKVDGIGRPLRSWLFTPASRPDRFGKAAEVGADRAQALIGLAHPKFRAALTEAASRLHLL